MGFLVISLENGHKVLSCSGVSLPLNGDTILGRRRSSAGTIALRTNSKNTSARRNSSVRRRSSTIVMSGAGKSVMRRRSSTGGGHGSSHNKRRSSLGGLDPKDLLALISGSGKAVAAKRESFLKKKAVRRASVDDILAQMSAGIDMSKKQEDTMRRRLESERAELQKRRELIKAKKKEPTKLQKDMKERSYPRHPLIYHQHCEEMLVLFPKTPENFLPYSNRRNSYGGYGSFQYRRGSGRSSRRNSASSNRGNRNSADGASTGGKLLPHAHMLNRRNFMRKSSIETGTSHTRKSTAVERSTNSPSVANRTRRGSISGNGSRGNKKARPRMSWLFGQKKAVPGVQ